MESRRFTIADLLVAVALFAAGLTGLRLATLWESKEQSAQFLAALLAGSGFIGAAAFTPVRLKLAGMVVGVLVGAMLASLL